jgi:hypothetical protein
MDTRGGSLRRNKALVSKLSLLSLDPQEKDAVSFNASLGNGIGIRTTWQMPCPIKPSPTIPTFSKPDVVDRERRTILPRAFLTEARAKRQEWNTLLKSTIIEALGCLLIKLS